MGGRGLKRIFNCLCNKITPYNLLTMHRIRLVYSAWQTQLTTLVSNESIPVWGQPFWVLNVVHYNLKMTSNSDNLTPASIQHSFALQCSWVKSHCTGEILIRIVGKYANTSNFMTAAYTWLASVITERIQDIPVLPSVWVWCLMSHKGFWWRILGSSLTVGHPGISPFHVHTTGTTPVSVKINTMV